MIRYRTIKICSHFTDEELLNKKWFFCPFCGYYRKDVKRCPMCNMVKTLDNFCPSYRLSSVFSKRCRLCDRKMYLKRRVGPTYKQSMIIHSKNYSKKYPEKRRALGMVARAVRSGRLIKPKNCSKCGKIGRIHGHHPDYSKPLEVIWLCVICHEKEHHGVIE